MFGETLRTERRRAGLTQEELAAKAGLNVRTIRKVEANVIANPRPTTVRLLADALDLRGDDRERFYAAEVPPARVVARPDRPVPAQLPGDVFGFTGRAEQMRVLTALVDDHRAAGPGPMSIAVLTGPAGVGKTALTVHWAHQVTDRFPDGQLYANLRGFATSQPLRPLDVLAQFLGALGVPPDQIPVDAAEAANLYRSMLAGRRMLLLLDNARDAGQVRPLLPGEPACTVVVTSRSALTGLVARDGAQRIAVAALAPDESTELLTLLLGADRIGAEPTAVAELAGLCGGLPLALRIAAAHLTAKRHLRIAGYTGRLRAGDRLAALAVEEDEQAAVRVAFDQSYAALPGDQRRLFRLLSAVPGPDFTAALAAELVGLSPDRAGRLLDGLAEAHLLDEPRPDRYSFHDLLREYAGQLATTEETDTVLSAAANRVNDWYLRHCAAAADVLYPLLLRMHRSETLAKTFDGPAMALDWLDDESSNLVAATVHAATHGPHRTACLLADVLRGYLWLRSRFVDALVVAYAARTAARTTGDPRALAAAHLNLGVTHMFRCSYHDSIRHCRQALAAARRAEWPTAEANALGYLGVCYTDLERFPTAIDRLRRALAINRRLGETAREAAKHGYLARVYTVIGHLRKAEAHLESALALGCEPIGNATHLLQLGYVRHELGQLDKAFDNYTDAMSIILEFGHVANEVWVRARLARVHCDAGRLAEAREEASAAVRRADPTDQGDITSVAYTALAYIDNRLGRHRDAADHADHARILASRVDVHFLQVDAMLALATAHRGLGDLDDAMGNAQQAITMSQEHGYRVMAGRARLTLAEACFAAGRNDDAMEHAGQALDVLSAAGHRLGVARAHVLIGHERGRLGSAEVAAIHWKKALDLYAAAGSSEVDSVRRLMSNEIVARDRSGPLWMVGGGSNKID